MRSELRARGGFLVGDKVGGGIRLRTREALLIYVPFLRFHLLWHHLSRVLVAQAILEPPVPVAGHR